MIDTKASGVARFLIAVGATGLWVSSGCYSGLNGGGPDPDDLGLGGNPGADSSATSEGPGGDDGVDPPEQASMSPSGLRFLTRAQYDDTIRDLLGVDASLARAFPRDARVGPFANNAEIPVSALHLQHYMTAAESIAELTELAPLLPCSLAEPDPDCAIAFVEQFGRRAFRRPLDEAQREVLLHHFDLGEAQGGFEAGVRRVIRAALHMPDFLYLLEIGEPVDGHDDVFRLDDFELASRLSYSLWNSLPDDALLDATEAGELSQPEGLEAQVERMLDDPRLANGLATFFDHWLGVDELSALSKSAETFPDFDDELVDLMAAERRRLVYDVVADEGGTLTDLLSVSHSFVDERLAGLYGTDITAQETPDGDGVRRVEFDPDRRAGILTQPGLLATHASPTESSLVLRGKFIRERLLCGTIAPPPGDVDTDLPPPSPDLSPRERWEEHLTDPTCASCHLLMDPLGFAFEHYDAIGRWRDQIGPWNVDAAGELTGTDVDGPFDGPVELSAKLARSQIAADCFVRQWMLYAFARNLGDDRDLVDDLASQWGGPDRAVRTLLHDIVTSDAFRYRKVQP